VREGVGREGQGPGRKSEGHGAEPVVTREIAAEAAVWIAKLHGPSRSIRLERECLAWQAASPAHRLAFERCTDLWMDAAGVDRAAVAQAATANWLEEQVREGAATRPVNGEPTAWHWPGARALALVVTATVLMAGVMVLQPWRDIDTYGTGIGEQRVVILKDGTRMSLNTSTRVRVELDQARRRVSVEGGEAFFEVAKDTSRPFVVAAAGTEVTATGTAFVVRLVPSRAGASQTLDVTLVEGQVVVQGSGNKVLPTMVQPIVMVAGGRVRVRTQGDSATSVPAVAAPAHDRPRLDQVLAWKRGEAIFDNASLQEALAEMNRYSLTPILVDARVADLRVSGVFKTGDNAGFVHAVAKLHGLLVRELPDRKELAPG